VINKPKSWLWKFTFPFAHNNYTTIGDSLYYPPKFPPSASVMAHEAIHSMQQANTGFVKYLFLYIFAFPVLWNPWRFKWELEAYVMGSKLSVDQSKEILRSYQYGWLKNAT
jgi:hypothetical protein